MKGSVPVRARSICSGGPVKEDNTLNNASRYG